MRKLFTVIAIVATMFSVVKASEAPVLETKIIVSGNCIIHENPNYKEVFIYSDGNFTKLVKIVTIESNDKIVAIK